MRHVVLLAGGEAPASAASAPAPAPAIVCLPHPRTRQPREYLLQCGRALEFTRVAAPATAPSSWFLDQCIKSDGSLLTATCVDPVFFLLPVLEACGGRFSPLHQVLSSFPGGDCRALLGLAGLQARLGEVSEQRAGLGPALDDVLVRLDRPRALALLAAKVQRLARALQEEAEGARARARAAMEGTFQVATSEAAAAAGGAGASPQGASPPAPLQGAHLEAALGLVAEYLGDAWVGELAERAGCSAAASAAGAVVTPEVAAEASRAAAWDASAAHDPFTAISKYVHGQRVKEGGGSGGAGGGGAGAGSGAKKPTPAANKLAAAAKGKGVQSVASFFAVKKS
jgi:hypothetical protein